MLHDISGKLILAGIMFLVVDIWMHRATQAEIIYESKIASDGFRDKAVIEVRKIADELKDLAIIEAEKASEKVKEAAIEQAKSLKSAALMEIESAINQATQKIVDAKISKEIQHAIDAIGANTPLDFSFDIKIAVSNQSNGLSIDVEEIIKIKNDTPTPQKVEFKKRISHRVMMLKKDNKPEAEKQFDETDTLHKYVVNPGEDVEVILKHAVKKKGFNAKKEIFPLFTVGANKYRVFLTAPTDVDIDLVLLGNLSEYVKTNELVGSKLVKEWLYTIDCPILPFTPVILKFRKKELLNREKIDKDSFDNDKESDGYISDVDE